MARASPAALRLRRGETTAIRAARSPERARSPRGRRAAWIGLLGLLLLDSSLAGAQDPQPAAAPERPAPTASPARVDVTSIPARLEETSVRLHWIEDTLARNLAIDEIAAELPDRRSRIEELIAETREQLGRSPDLLQLNFLATRLRSKQQGIAPWQKTLAQVMEKAERVLDEIRGERSLWIETQKSLSPGDLPAALEQRLQETLARLDGIEAHMRANRERTLVLADEIGRDQVALEDLIGDVERGYIGARRRMLSFDGPPLWRALSAGPSTLGAEGAAVGSRIGARIAGYLTDEPEAPLRQLALFALFVAVGYALARRAHPRPPDLGPNATLLLDHPLSVALLLAVLATPWLQPNAPPLVRELLGLLAVVSIMRVLSRIHDADLRRAIAVAIPAWLLERTATFLPVDSLLGRLILLISSLFGFAILLAMTRRESIERLHAGRSWRSLFTVFARFGVVGFGLAVLANLFGAVSFARGMTSWLLTTSVIALILYIGARLLRGLVEAALAVPPLGDLALVRRRRRWIEERAAAFVAFVFLLFWFWQGLVRAGADVAIGDWIGESLAYPLTIGTLSITPGNVVAFVVVLWVAIALSRLLGTILEEEVLPRMALPRGVPRAISSGLRYVFLAAGAVVAISAAGIDLGRLGLVVGALGVGIGFGFQNVVNNFVSGVILLFERPVQIGDTIEVGSLIGEVRRIGIRSSTVRTWEGAEVIVPNEKLVSAELVNWTLSDRHRRIELEVGVAYGTDPSRVVALLEGAALASSATLSDPAPHATLVGFGDSALLFRLRFWTSDLAEQFRARGEVAMGVHRALAEAGIEIPFPQRVVHVPLTIDKTEQSIE